MKRFLWYFFIMSTTVIINIYLIFYWNPNRYNDQMVVNMDKNYNNIKSERSSIHKLNNTSDLIYQSFYIDNYNSIGSLDDEDKLEINKILNRLSTSDFGKWIDVNEKGDNYSILEFFNLINKRLSENDYEKIKEILSEILDISRIEDELKNNYV